MDDAEYTSNEGELLSIPIVNAGDTVTFSISNDTGTEQEVPEDTTLKTYSLYEFSGSNFNGTGSPLAVLSKRLKVNTNGSNNLTNASWELELQDSNVQFSYSSSYIGDPTDFTYGVTLDTIFVIDMLSTGFDFNGWNIKIDSDVQSYNSTSYWTILPPYIKFNHIKYTEPVELPYISSSQAAKNVVKFVPVSDDSTYNPFTNTGGTNNITYVDQREKSISDFVNTPVSTPYEVYVEGNTYTISYCLGLQTESHDPIPLTNPSTLNPLFSGPANELLDISASSSVFWTNTPGPNNSSVLMNFRQPTLSDLYTSYEHTGVNPVQPNILINIGSFFYPALTAYLNLPVGDGVRTNLYTYEVNKNETGNDFDDIYGTYDITVYKYIPVGISDWNDYNVTNPASSTSKKLILTYNERYYYQKSIPMPLGNGDNVNDYTEKVKSNMPLNDIEWTLDEDYDGTQDSVIIQYLSKNAKTEIPTAFFTLPSNLVNSNGDSLNLKGVLVNQQPLFTILNKIGYPNMTINNNGTVTTSSVTLTITPA